MSAFRCSSFFMARCRTRPPQCDPRHLGSCRRNLSLAPMHSSSGFYTGNGISAPPPRPFPCRCAYLRLINLFPNQLILFRSGTNIKDHDGRRGTGASFCILYLHLSYPPTPPACLSSAHFFSSLRPACGSSLSQYHTVISSRVRCAPPLPFNS